MNGKNEQTMITFVVVGLLYIENIFVASSTMYIPTHKLLLNYITKILIMRTRLRPN